MDEKSFLGDLVANTQDDVKSAGILAAYFICACLKDLSQKERDVILATSGIPLNTQAFQSQSFRETSAALGTERPLENIRFTEYFFAQAHKFPSGWNIIRDHVAPIVSELPDSVRKRMSETYSVLKAPQLAELVYPSLRNSL